MMVVDVACFLCFNARQDAFVKFHWKPKLGVHALDWDEAQKIAGKDQIFFAGIFQVYRYWQFS
jgi:catalase